MPQMAPMWWTMIMLFTISMMMFTIMTIFFNYIKLIKFSTEKNKKKLNWKWY